MTSLRLPDGRSLDLQVDGPDDGPVLVYVHGTPSSGLIPDDLGRAALGRGMRLVSWSRPGYSTSARQADRTVASFAADAEAVLDELGVERAWAAGWSGGGPHALALAALLPHRFHAVATLAGVAPYAESQGSLDWLAGMGQDNLDEFGASLEGEDPLRRYLDAHVTALRGVRPADIVASMGSLLPDVDRAHLGGDFGEFIAQSFRESLSVSADGWVDDDLAFVEPWGFDLASIHVPVTVWQGSADLMVPFAHGEWLAAHVPGARARLLEGDGHLSIVVGRADEIVEDLLS
jgi:pimeloyl-ACP methyl ester carboxylesterase